MEGSSPLNGIVLARFGPQVGVETDDEIDAYNRANTYVLLQLQWNDPHLTIRCHYKQWISLASYVYLPDGQKWHHRWRR